MELACHLFSWFLMFYIYLQKLNINIITFYFERNQEITPQLFYTYLHTDLYVYFFRFELLEIETELHVY